MPDTAAYPVRSLREHATALEAALSVCVAEPDKRAVHKLRTETRRIEAQVKLLARMRGLPTHRKQAKKLLRQTKKLRRAAGAVRDLDVQQKLIKNEAPAVLEGADNPASVKAHFDDLLASRETQREGLAAELMQVLAKRQGKVAGALEALLAALEPVRDRSTPAEVFTALIEQAFRATPELRKRQPDDEDLHTIRKAAKTARYQAEAGGPGAPVLEAAKRFEELQDAGGLWHDWLDLEALAARELGEHHRITLAFGAERQRFLGGYQRLLAARKQMAAGSAKKPGSKSQGATKKIAVKQTSVKQTKAKQAEAKQTEAKQAGAKQTAAKQPSARKTAAKRRAAKQPPAPDDASSIASAEAVDAAG